MQLNDWSKDLSVEVAGHGVVSHAGSAVLRLLGDNTGLTGALSKALARRGFTPVHDRGRVLIDTAVCIADGGRVLSDLAVLRDQGELYGPVASDSTLWRSLEEIGVEQRRWIATARAASTSRASERQADPLRRRLYATNATGGCDVEIAPMVAVLHW